MIHKKLLKNRMRLFVFLEESSTIVKSFFLSAFISCLLIQNIFAQAPTITNFTPTSGTIGTTVTIAGTNFNATPDNNIVVFGATRATVSAANANQLSVIVPVGATHDFISVLNSSNGLMANSGIKFIPTYTPNSGTITASDFEVAVYFPTVAAYLRVAIADLDGDGKPDFALPGEQGIISILRNTSTPGTISCAPSVDLPVRSNDYESNDISIADLDGDGKPDMVSTYSFWTGSQVLNYVSVYLNTSTQGAISFAERVDYSGPVNYFAAVSKISDIDGDGKLDIVVNQPGSAKFVLRNTSTVGSISFANPVYLNGPNVNAEDLQAGDLDGDGKPELIFTSYLYGYVSVLRNTSELGTISFASYVNFSVATLWSKELSIGDLDGDGMLDIAVVSDQFYISLLRNVSTPGNLVFEPRIDIATGVNATSIPLGDIDGDGRLDMASQDHGYSKLHLYKNESSVGNINFADRVEIPSNMYNLKIADVDGDGKPELLGVVSSGLGILRNSSASLSVEEISEISNIVIYPNPAKDNLNITSRDNFIIKSLEIMDVSGRVLQTIKPDFSNELSINVSHLSAGNYVLKLQSENGIAIKKFIKN